MSMALNPQYDAIGKGFVQQYYTLFDDPAQRPNLANMYNVKREPPAESVIAKCICNEAIRTFIQYNTNITIVKSAFTFNFTDVETSFMSFEGVQLQGAVKIMDKLNSLTFQKIGRLITSVDSQPMFDGGVLINVLGRLQCDDDPPHPYMQTFVLKPLGDSFFVQHDIFRLGIHDVA